MMLSQIRTLFQQIQPCVLCKTYPATQASVCTACWQALAWLNQQVCRHEVTCQVSLAYAFPIKDVIHQYKNQQQTHYLDFLVGCLATQKPYLSDKIQAIVPMPIADEKLIARGFDHIAVLAKRLSQLWHIPVWQPVARRASLQQRHLNRSERLENLQGKFYLQQDECRYQRVLMLDDVITTGASLAALATQLQTLGCREVSALCLCDAGQKG